MRKTDDYIPIKTIDDYLSRIPAEQGAILEKIRRAIRSAAPKAEETISYQIPCFRQDYLLVGFAAFKKHCSFFPMSKAVVRSFKEELAPYDVDPGTIRFTVDKPMPAALIKKMVKARLAEIEIKNMIKEQKKKETNKTALLKKAKK
jgi:uncharacterized protein YdhG (YjbR/CyaY superfamily)